MIGVHAVEAAKSTLREWIISSYPTDAVASQHLTNLQDTWSYRKDGLILSKGLVYVRKSPLRIDILQEHSNAPLASHSGIATTIELITQNYWFPHIKTFTKDYINSCYLCPQGKALRHPCHS